MSKARKGDELPDMVTIGMRSGKRVQQVKTVGFHHQLLYSQYPHLTVPSHNILYGQSFHPSFKALNSNTYIPPAPYCDNNRIISLCPILDAI